MGMTYNFYAGGGIDRVSHLRTDAAWLAARLDDPSTRLIPVWRSQSLVVNGESPGAVRIALAEARGLLELARISVMLGLIDDAAHVAIDLSHIDRQAIEDLLGPWGLITDLRRVGPLLERREGALLAYARGMLHWHQRHRFCGVCGAPTTSTRAGHVLKCTGSTCGAEHFPRSDPAVIMLVHHGERCLLGRQSIWPKGAYSTLAGFVEPGESLEEAVAREVFEETSVRVEDVRYHSSQPWPFPGSLMLGFHARALDPSTLLADPEEIEDAQWFSRSDIAEFPRRGLFLPRMDSIARRLVEDWVAEGV